MSKVFKVRENDPIDLGKYVNTDTGELLSSELQPGDTVTKTKETGMKVIVSANYSVIDSDAVVYLSGVLNNADMGNLLKLGVLTKTPLNIVFNENIPHTNESLQRYLRIASEAMFLKLIKRLMTAGILYQIKGRIYGEVRVCYMLNPYLSRKRKHFEDKVFQVFEKFQLECKDCPESSQ